MANGRQLISSLVSRLRVWHVLALAFAVRFAVGLSTDSVLHPDETMEYLEQAHRLAFGPGMIPWEYDYGTRSWAPALFIAAALDAVRRAGFDAPQVYQPVVKAMLSAASLAIPYSAYRLGRALFTEHAGRVALIFTAFWYELVTYGHRPTIDAVAAYPAFGALALAFAQPRRRVTVGCGVLLGLTCVLRYQLAPAITVIGLVAIWRWRWRAWPSVLAGLVVVVAGGALDVYTWGVWFASIVINWDFNIGQNLSVIFGTKPFYWYAITVVVLSGGLCLAGALGLLLSWRQSWPLTAVALATAGTFSAVAHKEPRFVFLLTPLWLIGLAALTADRGRLLASALPRVAPAVAAFLVAGFSAVSLFGLFGRLPYENRYIGRQIARVPTREAYRALAAERDVTAVLDASATDADSSWYLAPYYDLHQDVPLYWPLSNGFLIVQADPRRYVSHVITPASRSAPPGFQELTRVGRLTIWRRGDEWRVTDIVPGWEPRIHALKPIPTPPTVLPRW